eukprot:scaffold328501_cov147-Tisochrysis_lutea.AAC.1
MTRLTTEGQRASNDARNAAAPCERSSSSMPAACIRELTELLAAMPTPAHGPHWTLHDAPPRARRLVLSASKQLFAAA